MFRLSDYVQKVEDKKWGLPVMWANTFSQDDSVWTQNEDLSLSLDGSSSWPMTSHLVTPSWCGMIQELCHGPSYGKPNSLFFVWETKSDRVCEATSWDPNFVLPVPSPLTIYFNKWKLNCFIKFPNATFTKQKRQSKQKLPRLKGINPKTKEWMIMFSRNN